MTASGEPMGFKPYGYKAATHLAEVLLRGCCAGAGARQPAQQAPAADRNVVLVGFSKGAVVVNQLLAEMAWQEEALQAGLPVEGLPPLDVHQRLEQPAAAGPAGVPPRRPLPGGLPGCRVPTLPPAAAGELLDAISVVHFLDAGLNSRGVHLTDPAVAAGLGQRQRRRPLLVWLHGTPRQWGDRRRPWIAQERDRFVAALQQAGVPVRLTQYFGGQQPTLRQHFDIISHMRVADGEPSTIDGECPT